ncbi:MAG: glycosyltransferase [Candidatus Moranbacteria bacterium]|nr:glycosyltransferase [Candidatus Moranbacteria bacterium]
MKVAVYNEHLSTAGGGEKYMGSIVEYLVAKGHSVDLISGKEVDASIFDRLNLNMGACNILNANDFGVSVSEKSSEYDLFLNVTYQSQLIPRAKHNAIVIFFPIIPSVKILAKSRAVHGLLRFIDSVRSVEFVSGMNAEEKIGAYHKRRFGNWSKREFSFVLRDRRKKRRPSNVFIHTLPLRGGDLKGLIREIRVGDRPADFSVRGPVIAVPLRLGQANDVVTVRLKSVLESDRDGRELGIFITGVSERGTVLTRIGSLLRNLLHDVLTYDYLWHYETVITISRYSESWLKRMWNRDSRILFPSVDTDKFSFSEGKKKIIVSCGRFFEGGHNKKHLFMIRMFKRMYDAKMLTGWEYHVCGGTHPEKNHQEYLGKVKKSAEGYPIFIHEDIELEALRSLYAEATVFWHAAGFGESEKLHPDKFEHFGITTVEAMSAGCIPLVINRGGQKEIVTDGIDGYLFDTDREMMAKMAKIGIMTDEERRAISARAREHSDRFSREAFATRMDEIFRTINRTGQDD